MRRKPTLTPQRARSDSTNLAALSPLSRAIGVERHPRAARIVSTFPQVPPVCANHGASPTSTTSSATWPRPVMEGRSRRGRLREWRSIEPKTMEGCARCHAFGRTEVVDVERGLVRLDMGYPNAWGVSSPLVGRQEGAE